MSEPSQVSTNPIQIFKVSTELTTSEGGETWHRLFAIFAPLLCIPGVLCGAIIGQMDIFQDGTTDARRIQAKSRAGVRVMRAVQL